MAGTSCPKCGKPVNEAVLIGGPLDGAVITVEGIPKAILTRHVETDAERRCRLVPHVWWLILRDEDGSPSIDDNGRYRYHP